MKVAKPPKEKRKTSRPMVGLHNRRSSMKNRSSIIIKKKGLNKKTNLLQLSRNSSHKNIQISGKKGKRRIILSDNIYNVVKKENEEEATHNIKENEIIKNVNINSNILNEDLNYLPTNIIEKEKNENEVISLFNPITVNDNNEEIINDINSDSDDSEENIIDYHQINEINPSYSIDFGIINQDIDDEEYIEYIPFINRSSNTLTIWLFSQSKDYIFPDSLTVNKQSSENIEIELLYKNKSNGNFEDVINIKSSQFSNQSILLYGYISNPINCNLQPYTNFPTLELGQKYSISTTLYNKSPYDIIFYIEDYSNDNFLTNIGIGENNIQHLPSYKSIPLVITYYPVNIGNHELSISIHIISPNDIIFNKFPKEEIIIKGNCIETLEVTKKYIEKTIIEDRTKPFNPQSNIDGNKNELVIPKLLPNDFYIKEKDEKENDIITNNITIINDNKQDISKSKTISLKSVKLKDRDFSKIKIKSTNDNFIIKNKKVNELGEIEFTIELKDNNINSYEINDFIELTKEDGSKQIIPVTILPKINIDFSPNETIDFGMCSLEEMRSTKNVQLMNLSNMNLKYNLKIIQKNEDSFPSFAIFSSDNGEIKSNDIALIKIQFNAYVNGNFEDELYCSFKNDNNEIVLEKRWNLKAIAFNNQINGLPIDTIKFGTVSVGQSREIKYLLENQSNIDINCSFHVNNPFYLNKENIEINSKCTEELIISFLPTQTGIIEENLEIFIVNKPYNIKIIGIGGNSELRCNLLNNSYDFQLMEYGSKHTIAFTLTNNGSRPLKIKQIKVTEQTPLRIIYQKKSMKNKVTEPKLKVKRNPWSILRQNLFLAVTNILLDEAVMDNLYVNHGDILEQLQKNKSYKAAQKISGILRLERLGRKKRKKILNSDITYLPYDSIIESYSDDEETPNESKKVYSFNNISLITTKINYDKLIPELNPNESYIIEFECEPHAQIEFESCVEFYYETFDDTEVIQSLDTSQLITSEDRIKILPINIKGRCLAKVVFSPVKYSFGPTAALSVTSSSALSFNTKPFLLNVQNLSSKMQTIILDNISSDVFEITGNQWDLESGSQLVLPISFYPKYPNVEYKGNISFRDMFTTHVIQMRGLGASAQFFIKENDYIKYQDNKYIINFGTIKPWKKYSKDIIIKNVGLLSMPYKIIMNTKYPFTVNDINKKKGLLHKNDYTTDIISFSPELYRKNEELPLVIEELLKWKGVKYGSYFSIPLLIECKFGLPTCEISKNEIDFGLTFVNKEKIIQITLTNNGEADTDWFVIQSKIIGLSVEPSEGNILSGKSQIVNIIYKPIAPLTLYDTLELQWDCGKIEILCHGLVGIPSLSHPVQFDYDYDIIEVNTSKDFSVSIANTGNIHLAYVYVLGIDKTIEELKEQADNILNSMEEDVNMRDIKAVENKQEDYNNEIINYDNSLYITNYRNYIRYTTKQVTKFHICPNEYKKEYKYTLLFHYLGGEYYTGFIRFVGGQAELQIIPTNPASSNESIDLGIIKVNEKYNSEIFSVQNIGNIPVNIDLSHHIFMSVETLSDKQINVDDCSIDITPQHCYLEPNELSPISLSFMQMNNPAMFNFTIDLIGNSIAAKYMASVQVSIEVGKAQIIIEQEDIHFERIQIDTVTNKIFTIKNEGNYPGEYTIKLLDENNEMLNSEMLSIFSLDNDNGIIEGHSSVSHSIFFSPREISKTNKPNYICLVSIESDGKEYIFLVDGIGSTASLEWNVIQKPPSVIPKSESEFIKVGKCLRNILDFGIIHINTKAIKSIEIKNKSEYPFLKYNNNL